MKQHLIINRTKEDNASVKLKIDAKEIQLSISLREIAILKASINNK